jgi:TolA-binding protein
MNEMRRGKLRAVALAVLACGTSLVAVPVVHAQEGTVEEIRLRKLEAEVRALQRQVFPGGDPKFFPSDGSTPAAPTPQPGSPATTPVTDLLTRMDALEAQNARLTAQVEDLSHRLRKMEGAAPSAPAGTVTPPPVMGPQGDVGATPLPAAQPAATPPPAPKPRPVVAEPPARPTAARLAAVKAIVKPQTDDPGEDEYTYGFKLWEAKFYPEAAQQLKLYLEKYPRHKRVSYAKNLLGRAYLDDNQPREAANWFLQNYQGNKRGDRAADSLLYLAQAMVDLKDSSRACIALGEFSDTYKTEAAGRLRSQYDDVRKRAACN